MPNRTQPTSRSQKFAVISLGLFLLFFGILAIGCVLLSEGYLLKTLLVDNSRPPSVSPVPDKVSRPVQATSTPKNLGLPSPISETTTLLPVPKPPDPALGNSPFGISVGDTLTGLSEEALNARLRDMVSLHLGWVRLDIDWSSVQRRGRESFDWSRLDRVIKTAEAHNLKVLPILVYTPVWARSGNCNDSNRCRPADPQAFADFAHAAVKRYAPLGIHQWEIWNEPNMRGSWMPAANPAEYTALLRAAYLSIKKEDPSAIVITGGLGPIDSRNGNIAPRDFLSDIYREGAGLYFDAVGFHPYSFPVTASYDASWNAWQQMSDTHPSLRSIMIDNGDAVKEIWITEYGAPTNGPGDAASIDTSLEHHTDHVTEELQALTLTQAVEHVKKYSWAGPFFWYSYKDLGTSEHSIENFFGLLRFDGSHKPAYDALKELLSGAE